MVYELTNEEKKGILEQHLKNLEYNRYNLEVSMIELTNSTILKEESIENIQLEIDSLVVQKNALIAEIQSLS
jgi:hypothetical protein